MKCINYFLSFDITHKLKYSALVPHSTPFSPTSFESTYNFQLSFFDYLDQRWVNPNTFGPATWKPTTPFDLVIDVSQIPFDTTIIPDPTKLISMVKDRPLSTSHFVCASEDIRTLQCEVPLGRPFLAWDDHRYLITPDIRQIPSHMCIRRGWAR